MTKRDYAAMRKKGLATKEARERMTLAERLADAGLDLDEPALGQILARLAEMPTTQRQAYIQAMTGGSPTAGIRAFCAMCVCWVRTEVTLCTDRACPLYPYRPYQTADDKGEDDSEENPS